MKEREVITQLEKENRELKEQNAGLTKRLEELEKQKPKSKSRQQAEEGLKMLQSGPVGISDFTKLNDRYPGDVVYYIRSLLKMSVHTVRVAGKGTLYMLNEHFQRYQETAAKAKVAADEAKEEIPAPPISKAAEATNHIAV